MTISRKALKLYDAIKNAANYGGFDKEGNLPRSKVGASMAGLRFYFTGKPCRRGHRSARRTIDSSCIDCIEITNRRWPLANPEGAARLRQKNKLRQQQKRKEAQQKAGGVEFRRSFENSAPDCDEPNAPPPLDSC